MDDNQHDNADISKSTTTMIVASLENQVDESKSGNMLRNPSTTFKGNKIKDSEILNGSDEIEQKAGFSELATEQPHPINPLNLHLISHPERGRGVFAPESILPGTVIEESPVLVIIKKEWEDGNMNDTILGSYGFCWKDGGMGIGLGLASLFNHSSTPNVNFIRSYSTSTIKFVTFKKIEKGEELCICYSADESKLWFVKSEDIQNQSVMVTSSESEDEDGNGFFSKIDLETEDLIDENSLELQKQRKKRLQSSQSRDFNGKIKPNSMKSSDTSRIYPNDIQSPQPIKFSASSSVNALAGPSGTSLSTPISISESSTRQSTPSSTAIYPEASSSIIPASLPAPLHSNNSSKSLASSLSEEYAELVDELDWDEEYWTSTNPGPTGKGRENDYAEFLRIKGPAEEDDDGDVHATMDIWTLEFTDPKLTRTALDFSKHITAEDERLRHLKRVRRRKENNQEICRVVLGMAADYDVPSLRSVMTAFSTTLSDLIPILHKVPISSARTTEQIKIKSHIWPVTFSPIPIIPNNSIEAGWSIGYKAWLTSGVKRIIDIALEAKSKGELPIGVYCTHEPSIFWPKKGAEGFIEPTEGLRASSYDTTISEKHPLRHSILNCVKKIAKYRQQKPFIDIQPLKNGSDYLLNGLTLFITHEPCIMCSMALLHSRVKQVIYIFERKKGGGFRTGSGLGINSRNDLNHKFQVWKFDGYISEDTRRQLDFDENIQV
ncbi:uncharacterized protein L201_000979 [Kwoniella dendrophila CBS 6074]|uniref:SET domain-containing protein n=1 Tax=Kwoniella dendrophila CBS 6074 TaxID=1295534 RepID=A0AAX4JML2_9TREE